MAKGRPVASPKPEASSFGELLDWHLLSGTRPRGSIDQGRAWGKERFADQIGISPRQLRNWLSNKNLPDEIESVEAALFGNNQGHAREERLELREAYRWVKFGPSSNITILAPTHFMGKEEAVASIDAALTQQEAHPAIAVLHGLRGVGKTTIATGYAEWHRRDYRATWWIRAQSDSSMRADLVALGVRLGWTRADNEEDRALDLVLERLRAEGEKILLIYDNAIDAKQTKPYLPRGGMAHVLITSNAHAWRALGVTIEVRVWPKERGANYLIARTGRGPEVAASELSEMLGGLPLALEQAAAYCEHLEVSFTEYRKRFEATPARLLDDARHAPTEYYNGLTVAKTLSLAIREAKKLHPAAEALIVHAALLPAEPIPLFLFSEAAERYRDPLLSALDGDAVAEAVAALRAFALVGREVIADERDVTVKTDVIRLHLLVRLVASGLWKVEARQEARYSLIEALVAVYPRFVWRDSSTWPRTRRLDPLAVAIVGENKIADPNIEKLAADLLTWGGQYRQYALAAYAEAKSLFDRAFTIRKTLFHDDHPEMATSLNSLAGVLQHQGDLAAARVLYERALDIRERALGAGHSDTAMSLNNLADLLRLQGQLEAALRMYERAFATWQKVHGLEHPDTATSLRNIARVLQDQGKLAEARPRFELSLEIREKVLGPRHPGTATSLENLATLLRAQGELDAARPLYERALEIQSAVLGAEHPRTTMCLSNFGSLLCDLGETDKAELHLSYAVTVGSKTLGIEHSETQRYQCQYARLLLKTNRAANAQVLAAAALTTHAAVNGPSHPWTRDSASVAADALDALGRQDEAAALRNKYIVKE